MKNWLATLLGIGRVIWDFLRPIVFGQTAGALEKILPHALGIVENLDDGSDEGEAKRAEAVRLLKRVALTLGVSVGTAVLNLAVELAVQKLREKS